MKKRLLSLALCLVLCLGLLPTTAWATENSVDAPYDTVKADGTIERGGKSISGDAYTDTPTDNVTWGEVSYVIRNDVTIKGDLTINARSSFARVFLCNGAKLTINGTLKFAQGSNPLHIFGQTTAEGGQTGTLIINHTDSGAAIQSESTDGSTLYIHSGKLEINSVSGDLVNNVKLEVENYYQESGDCKVMKATLTDASGSSEELKYEDWAGKVVSLTGNKLVIEYCDHRESDATYTHIEGTNTHTERCTLCSFSQTDECELYAVNVTNTTHTMGCYLCDNTLTEEQHTPDPGNTACVPTADGTGHSKNVCSVCQYPFGDSEAHTYGTDGSCKECDFRPFMSDSAGNLYEKEDYQDAFEKAAAGEVTWVQLEDKATDPNDAGVWTKSIEFSYSGEPVTLKMNSVKLYSTDDAALTVSGGTLIIEDNATIKGEDGIAGNSSASAISVTGGNLTFKSTLTAIGGSINSYNDDATPAIEVSGGKVTFEGAVNATGGLQGVSSNAMTCKPAVYATGGELDFKGDLDLNGGLTVTGNAALTNKLTKGTFRVEYTKADGTTKESVTGPRVSVEGSKNYNYVRDLLADNRVFANLDPSDTNNKYFTASFESLGWNVAIEEHTHTWAANGENYSCTVCGQTCAHEGGYTNGACAVCGKPCPHAIADQSPTDYHYYCNVCRKQMFARIQTDTYNWSHYTDLKTALEAAEDGQTVLLLDDVDNSNQTACVTGDNKTVTLDLNGHTINEGWINVGIDEANKNFTSSTLKIVGHGSYILSGIPGILSIGHKATLDLSSWGGGQNDKITRIGLSKNGDIQPNPESTLIVGENTGYIAELGFLNWPSSGIKSKLNGGTYGEIKITTHLDEGEPYSGMLAEGYAFQYIDTGKFVEYKKKAEYTSVNTIYNVKVVKCPHDKVTNGTCDYCGKTGIAAMVDGVAYDSFAGALEDIKSNPNNRTLKLCADAQYGNTALNSNNLKYTKLTIDLNGYTLSGADGSSKLIQVIDDAELVIQDTSESKNGSVDNIQATLGTTAGHLTLESGAINTLQVAPDSNITLKAGSKVRYLATPGNEFAFPVAALLDFGYGLMDDSGNWADLTKTNVGTTNRTGYYTVTNVPNVGKHRGPSIMDTPYGRNTLPFTVDMKPDAPTDVTQVRFQWYRADTNRDVLADFTCNTPTSENEYVYDQSTKGSGNGWTDLTTGSSALLTCVVSGLDANDNTLWCMSTGKYLLRLGKGDLADAEITFPDGNESTFGPSDAVTHAHDFTVTHNGKTLTENIDYTVSGNTAPKVGTYQLTITAVENSKYTGSKSAEWKVTPHKVAVSVGDVIKAYDGTTTLPENSEIKLVGADSGYSYYLGKELPLIKGKDYKVLNAHYDSTNASEEEKNISFTIQLLDTNYTFSDGTTKKDVTLTGAETERTFKINKASAPEVKPVELTVTNDLAKTYELDLSKLLPTPESPKEYGEISYSLPIIHMDTPYYDIDTGAKIENGKLTLPIQKVITDQTGSIGTVTVNVTTQNYEDITLTVNVIAKNKITPAGQPTLTGEITYGDTLSTIKLSGSLKDGTTDVPGTFTWTTPSAVPDAGTYEAAWKFAPEDSSTYAETSGTTTITVNPKSIAGATVTLGDSLTYNGSEQTQTVTSVTLDKTPITSYEISGNKQTNAGDYELTINGTGNYTGEVKQAYSIARKAVTKPAIELSGDFTYTGEEIKPEVTVKDGEAIIPASEYTVSYNSNINAGTATVTITDKPGGNYIVNGSTEFTIAKAALTDVSVKQSEALTYNGKAQTAKVTTAATAKGNQAVTFTYSTEESGTYGEMPAFTDAGTYTVYYQASAANHETASGSFQVVIGQAPVTVKASDKSAYVGGTAPDLSKPELDKDYTVSGLFGEDTLKNAPKLSYVKTPDMSKVGEAEIKIEDAEVSSNYKLEYQNGKLSITTRPSSGSSGSTGTKTDTVKNPDGSTTKTETKADGSKTETTTATTPGGSTGSTVTKTDTKGNSQTEASAKLSDKDVKDAQEKGEAVTVPVKDIEAAKDSNSATEIKIDLPKNSGKTTVEIPVDNVTSGTVAVIVHPDGTEEIAKSSKPTEDGVQLEINGSTTVKIIDNSKDFIDTRDHWSRDEVNFVAARELFNGVGDNRFGVSQPMTRGMVNTVLARLSGVDTTPGQGQTWYEIGTEWAKKNGISDGTNPTGNVTREQLATLLYRYAGSPDVSGTLSFADANNVSDYAKNALLWANQNGIVSGMGNNTIAPKANAQRAQVAAMFARYLKNL